MPYIGDLYSLPPGTPGTPNTTIESAKYNTFIADIATAQNTARPVLGGGTGGQTAVAGNDGLNTKGADIASGATTNLAAATGVYLNITGTTTITSFGTVSAGAERVLTFTGILTLTYNATSMILPGAANITTAAGDSATFRSLGAGNWKCVNYERTTGGSGPVSGTTGTFSGDVTADAFIGNNSGANVIIATSTGTGTINFRPKGKASGTDAMTIDNNGNAVINGTLTVTDQAIFSVGADEIARTSSTALTIGKTSPSLATVGTTLFATSTSNGLFQCTRDSDIVGQFNVINPVGTETVLEFMTSGTAKGSITINGSTTAYNTTSDRRLKENPRPFDAGAILDKLKVYQFDWKAGGSGYGVFAQEAVKVFPDAVTKGKGKKTWKVDYSKFVPLLLQEVKALREEIRLLKG